jgi:acyl carrier protein
MYPKINELIAVILNVHIEAEANVEQTTTPAWDSLKHVELIFLLEDEFGLQITEEDMVELTSTAAIARYLSTRGRS